MSIKQLIISVLVVLLIIPVFAQEKIEVATSQKEMSQGIQTAYVVLIPESEPKMVEKEWKNFINDKNVFEFMGRGISNIFSNKEENSNKNTLRVKKIGNELVVRKVVHEAVVNHSLDVYAIITGSEKGVVLSSFFQYSDSIFINNKNTSDDILSSIHYFVREFAVSTYRKVVEEQLSEQQFILRKENRILNKLERENNSIHKSIAKYETDIDEYNSNIQFLEEDIKRMEKYSSELKDSLNRTDKDLVEYDSIKDSIKDKKKERKGIYRSIKSDKRKIKRNYNRINKAKSDIIINEKEQELEQELIKKQKLKIENLENMHININ